MNPAPQMTGPHASRLIDYVRNSRITEAVILTSFHQSPLPLALLLRLAGVERISGASTDYAGSLLDVRLRPGEDIPEDQPEAERALGIARAAGFPLPRGDDGKLRVHSVPDVRSWWGKGPTLWSTPERPCRPGPGPRSITPPPSNSWRVQGIAWW